VQHRRGVRGSFSARAWSPSTPNASTAVPIGPWSATIDATAGVRSQVVGVELTHVDRRPRLPSRTARPARPADRASGGQHDRRAGRQPAASSMPISLRPPKITTARTRVIHGCDYRLR
jgi:hypothetical protein